MPIGLLATNWPEPIKTEVAAMNGATVSLPADDVTAGLAKGRVAFSWGSLRAWTQPAPSGASAANEDTELLLPLRVVAPAFLKHSKQPGQPKKRVEIDEEIPALFHGGNQPEGAATETIEPRLSLAREEPAPVPVSEPAPAAAPVVPVAEPQPVPTAQTVGELFGQPSKTDWTPAEIVQNVATLPGMSGAVVSMREGLLVAQSMPEGLKGEAFAAFLPQVFSRLNQYAGEMSLGEVDELTINAQGARCRLFRLGEVLFAALGRAGEPLPSQALRLCAEQLRK